MNMNKLKKTNNTNINNKNNEENHYNTNNQNYIEYPKESLKITEDEDKLQLAMKELIKNIKKIHILIIYWNIK